MATAYKVLGQVSPAANVNTDLYVVGVGKSAVVSTLSVANTGTVPSVPVWVYVRPAGEAVATKHTILPGVGVDPADAAFFTIGLTLAATDVVTVRTSDPNMAFSLFGQEITP
jgi:hypothetical protein